MNTVEITIPVLNEAHTLDRQIRHVDAFLKESLDHQFCISIIIGDNGSTDATEAIGRALASDLERVEYLQVGKRGVGLALHASWSRSQADIIGYMDLDLATNLRHLREALEPLAEDRADLVVGSRLLPGSKVVGRTAKRAIVSRVFNFMLKTYLGVKFSDGMCGFKFLQRTHYEKLRTLGARSDGWFFSTELLAGAEHLRLRLVELPVEWTDDPDTKAKIGPLAVEYIKAMRTLKAKLKSQPT